MNYYNLSNDFIKGLLMSLGMFFFLFVAFLIVIVIFVLAGKWALYKKAGKNGWEAIVPFYNDYVYVEIAGLNWWWFLLIISPTIVSILKADNLNLLAYIASVFGLFMCNYNISKRFHRDAGFALLMTIFPFVMYPLIGFSNIYKWDSNVVVTKNGLINDNDNDDTSKDSSSDEESDYHYCSKCGAKIGIDARFCSKCGNEIK